MSAHTVRLRPRTYLRLVMAALVIAPAVLSAWPTVDVIPPPDWLFSNVHAWSCRIANTESTYHGVWLHAEIYARRQNWNRVYWVDSRVFDLPVGTGTWRLRDLEPLRNQDYMTGYEVFFLRAGVVPADSYRYSLTLSTGGGDTGDIVIRPMSPPRLRLPADGDTIREQYPQFAWFPVVPVPPGGVTYTLQVKEVLPGMTKEQAMASCPPWFEQRGITATQFQYPLSAQSLRSGAPAYVLKGSGPDTTDPGGRGPWDYDVAEQPSVTGNIRGRVFDPRPGVVGYPLKAVVDTAGCLVLSGRWCRDRLLLCLSEDRTKVEVDNLTNGPGADTSFDLARVRRISVLTESGVDRVYFDDSRGRLGLAGPLPGLDTLHEGEEVDTLPYLDEIRLKRGSRSIQWRSGPTNVPPGSYSLFAWKVIAMDRSGVSVASEVRQFAVAPPPPPPGPSGTVAATIVWQHFHQPQMAVPDIWFTDVYEDQHASPAAALCQLSGRDYDPAIAYDRSGNATVVWAHQGTANGKFSIYYSRRTSTAWSPPAALCPGAQSALYHNIDPAVAFDENGRGICVWVRVCEPPGDRNELYYSVWNGSGWSDSAAVYRLPPGADPYDTTFRYPEIAFTKSGQAVVVAVAKGNPLDPNAKPAVVCIPRSGSGWAAPTCVAGSEGAFGPKYSLPSEPARLRLSVAPDNQQDRVHVRWQKLYGGVWGTTGTSVSGTWTWSAPTQFSTGGPGAGTVVAGDGTTVKTVYGRGSHLWDETGHLPPDPYGPTGIRPSGAWLSGTTPGAIAVWHGFGGRIGWSFWNAANGSWLGPIPIPTPGIYQFNLNPDVAAKSGSHTMPPQQ